MIKHKNHSDRSRTVTPTGADYRRAAELPQAHSSDNVAAFQAALDSVARTGRPAQHPDSMLTLARGWFNRRPRQHACQRVSYARPEGQAV
jgi:hypothetical protein